MGAGYTVGDLNVSLLGDSIKATDAIDNVIQKLKKLQKVLTALNDVSIGNVGTNLTKVFGDIATALGGFNVDKLTNITTATKNFQKFITTIQKLDTSKVSDNLTKLFDNISKSVNSIDDATLQKLEKIGNAMSKLSSGKGLGALSGRKGGKSSKKDGGGFSFLNVAKWTTVIYMARRLGSAVANIAQKGADYVETLNLWEVSMKDNVSQSTEFVNKMNEAYGISKKTLMNAQAIFKNMLGSLGDISDSMAYQLSEGVTQMAVDYASLYNVQFEQAFTKFQSALAGQVRPIRSVSGFDITENTLYQLYQTLGGSKTMRQLSITEKRLLSIYAIFQQMEASGAIGDLKKTMNTFANQSRIMAESWQEVLSFSGLILTHLIQESGIMTKINGLLIFFGDVLEAVASEMGAIKSYGGSIFDSTENGALNASKAIDEVKGKLLGFDKFRTMSGGEGQDDISLDDTILNAFSGYQSILGSATLEASEFVNYLKTASGLFDESGIFQVEKWEEIVNAIEDFGLALGAIVISSTITKIISGVKELSFSLENFSNILIVGIVYAILKAIDAFKEGDIAMGIIASTIGVVLIGALIALKIAQMNATKTTTLMTQSLATNDQKLLENAQSASKTANAWKTVGISLTALTVSFSAVSGLLDMFGDGEAKKIASWCAIVVGAIMAIVAAIIALKTSASWGTMLPILLAGVGTAIAGVTALTPKVEQYAVGASNIDSGTMFVAGESGKTEMVYNGSNGKTNVANIQQMKSAFYQALVEYGKTQNNSQPIVVEVDGETLFVATRKVANKNGLDFSNVR